MPKAGERGFECRLPAECSTRSRTESISNRRVETTTMKHIDDGARFKAVRWTDLPKELLFACPRPPLRLERVVRPTAQLQVRRVRRPAIGKREDVVILQESSLRASACGADECTLPSVAGPHFAFHGRGHVPPGVRGAVCWARPRRCGISRFPKVREEQRQRAIEDFGDITGGHLVPQQCLGLSQPFVHRT